MNKKILALITASLLCVFMVACGGKDNDKQNTTTTVATTEVKKEEEIVGKWTIKSAVAESVTLDAAAIGLKIDIEFKEDGTVIFTEENSSSDEGKWEKTDKGVKITDGQEAIELTLKDGQLVMAEEGVEMFFTKQ